MLSRLSLGLFQKKSHFHHAFSLPLGLSIVDCRLSIAYWILVIRYSLLAFGLLIVDCLF